MIKTERNKIRALCSQLRAKCSELPDYAQKLHHFAEQHIVLDPEDGIKFNYSKLAPLLTKIHWELCTSSKILTGHFNWASLFWGNLIIKMSWRTELYNTNIFQGMQLAQSVWVRQAMSRLRVYCNMWCGRVLTDRREGEADAGRRIEPKSRSLNGFGRDRRPCHAEKRVVI